MKKLFASLLLIVALPAWAQAPYMPFADGVKHQSTAPSGLCSPSDSPDILADDTGVIYKCVTASYVAISSGVGGSGTANTLPKWATSTTLGNSHATDDDETFTVQMPAVSGIGGATVVVQAGVPGVGFGDGGGVGFFGGHGLVGNAAGGAGAFVGGNGNGNGTGGGFSFYGGTGGTDGDGGPIVIRAGLSNGYPGVEGLSGTGGTVNILGGDATATFSGNGGGVFITGGNASGSEDGGNGDGGNIDLTPGSGDGVGGLAGQVRICEPGAPTGCTALLTGFLTAPREQAFQDADGTIAFLDDIPSNSSDLAASLSDESGEGYVVFSTSALLTTPPASPAPPFWSIEGSNRQDLNNDGTPDSFSTPTLGSPVNYQYPASGSGNDNMSAIVFLPRYNVWLGIKNGATPKHGYVLSANGATNLADFDFPTQGGSNVDSEGVAITDPNGTLFYVSTEQLGSTEYVIEYLISDALSGNDSMPVRHQWTLPDAWCSNANSWEGLAFVPDSRFGPTYHTDIPRGYFKGLCQGVNTITDFVLDTDAGGTVVTPTAVDPQGDGTSAYAPPCSLNLGAGCGVDYDWRTGLLWYSVGTTVAVADANNNCLATFTVATPGSDAEGIGIGNGYLMIADDATTSGNITRYTKPIIPTDPYAAIATNTGDQLIFQTVNAPSGTDPVADTTTDTLNLTASGSLSITGDSSTDTVTFDVTETDAAHDNCAEITGCVPGALTSEVDGSTTNEIQNLFETVNAPAGTDPVADGATDTLNITASGSLSITGDSTTDTLAFVVTETDAAHDNCSEITGCTPSAPDGSGTTNTLARWTDSNTLQAGSIEDSGSTLTSTVNHGFIDGLVISNGLSVAAEISGGADLLISHVSAMATAIFDNFSVLAVKSAAGGTDGIALTGRTGGTDSFIGTFTPTTLTDSRTYTTPDANGTLALTSDITVNGSGSADYAARWIDSDTLGFGVLHDDGASVTIDGGSGSAALDLSALSGPFSYAIPDNGGTFWVDNFSDGLTAISDPLLVWDPAAGSGGGMQWFAGGGGYSFQMSQNSSTGLVTATTAGSGSKWLFSSGGSGNPALEVSGNFKATKVNLITITQPATGATITATDGTTTTLSGGTHSGTNTGDQTSVSGNAGTATALAADPADCGSNVFATSINASGTLGCSAIVDADVPDTITASNYQPLDSDLTSIAALTTTAAGRGVLETWAAPGANTAVNDTNDVSIVSHAVTGIAAGDQVLVEGVFNILNNSGSTRVYTVTMDWDSLFDAEIATLSLTNSASSEQAFFFTSVLDVRTSGLAYVNNMLVGGIAGGVASGADVAMSAGAGVMPSAATWGTTASDATGSTTFTLNVRSANNTATQTLRLHSLTIRKVTP